MEQSKNHIIGSEKAYPIYKIIVEWEQDGKHDPEHPENKSYKDMPEGRIRNSISLNLMKQEDLSEDELKIELNNFWLEYIKSEKMRITNHSVPTFKHTVFYETWNCDWFVHETFDQGQTDAEALKSFEAYVQRNEVDQTYFLRGGDLPKICLMGAEDRWRWYGTQDKDSGNRSSAPCRCESCKTAGKLRISH